MRSSSRRTSPMPNSAVSACTSSRLRSPSWRETARMTSAAPVRMPRPPSLGEHGDHHQSEAVPVVRGVGDGHAGHRDRRGGGEERGDQRGVARARWSPRAASAGRCRAGSPPGTRTAPAGRGDGETGAPDNLPAPEIRRQVGTDQLVVKAGRVCWAHSPRRRRRRCDVPSSATRRDRSPRRERLPPGAQARPEFAARKATKTIDGVPVTGWFTEDFTAGRAEDAAGQGAAAQVRVANTAFDGRFEVPTFQEVIDLARAESKARGRTIGSTRRPSTPG